MAGSIPWVSCTFGMPPAAASWHLYHSHPVRVAVLAFFWIVNWNLGKHTVELNTGGLPSHHCLVCIGDGLCVSLLTVHTERASLGKLLLLLVHRAVALLPTCFSLDDRGSKLQTVLSKLLQSGLFPLSFV